MVSRCPCWCWRWISSPRTRGYRIVLDNCMSTASCTVQTNWTWNGRQGEIIEMRLFNLDSDFITRSKQTQPDDWGTSQPHNSYEEMPWWMKAVISLKNRLDGGVITPDITFHQSCSVSPTTLTDPYGMVTLQILQQRFGSYWKPTYAPLNKFEQDCKANWKSQLVCLFPTWF